MARNSVFPSSSPQRGLRGRWSDDHFTLAWLVIAVVLCAIALAAPAVLPNPVWAPLHAVTLGVVSNGIFQWSWFFSRGLLHFPVSGATRYSTFIRLIVLNIGVVALYVAMWVDSVWLMVAAVVLICAAGAWQGIVIAVQVHRNRSNRYAPLVNYYSVSFLMFVLTCVAGGVLSYEMMAPSAPNWLIASANGVAVAHSVLGILGWAGLTIFGTVVTLGLSMLHARQDSHAIRNAAGSLPILAASVLVAAIGGMAGLPIMVDVGVAIYVLAVSWGVLFPLFSSFGLRRRSSHAVWALLAGLIWTVALLIAFAVECFLVPDMTALRTVILNHLALFMAAGIAQIFVTSLEYLLPVAIGGGPTVQRVGDVTISTGWPALFGIRNAALLLLIFAPDLAGVMFGVVLVCYGIDVLLTATAAVRQLLAKRRKLAVQEGRK